MKRNIYMTQNRLKIILFAKTKSGIITKAQVMDILSCSPDNAYEQIKSMIQSSLIEKIGTQKFRLK